MKPPNELEKRILDAVRYESMGDAEQSLKDALERVRLAQETTVLGISSVVFPVEHTGAAASWCPICGDCTCPRKSDGHWIEDPDAIAKAYERRGACPLHRLSRKH